MLKQSFIVSAIAVLCVSSYAQTFHITVPLTAMSQQDVRFSMRDASTQVPVGAAYDFNLATLLVSESANLDLIQWSIRGGSLPPGMSLSSAGIISGTSEAPGVYGFNAVASLGAVQASSRVSINVLHKGAIPKNTGEPSLVWTGRTYSITGGAERHVSLRNDGDLPMTIALENLPEHLSLESNECVDVAPGRSCRLTLKLKPITASVAYSEPLRIQAVNGATTEVDISINVDHRIELVSVVDDGYRWEDGTIARSCGEYLNAQAPYVSASTVGTAIYRLNPNGDHISALCDMVSDGGGWTLVVKSPRNSTTTTLMARSGDLAWLKNNDSAVGTHGSFGVASWAQNFPFTQAKIEFIAGDNPNHRVSFYKTVTYNNVASWIQYGVTEPDPTVICTNAAMTANCSGARFNHDYFGTANSYTVVMHGADMNIWGYSTPMPIHGQFSDLAVVSMGFCSSTAHQGWPDSYQDGHWGNGMHIWFR